MKKPLLLPCIALVGGAAAAVLRLFQNATGFEEETGLPISGNLPGTALVILLVLLAVILTLLGPASAGKQGSILSRRFHRPGFPPAFPAHGGSFPDGTVRCSGSDCRSGTNRNAPPRGAFPQQIPPA